MQQSVIEEKRNKLNLEIRCLLKIIEMIDGYEIQYTDYVTNSLDEEKYLDQQIEIVISGKERLLAIFKD